eukprot:3549165-Amphidinium_carterae.1
MTHDMRLWTCSTTCVQGALTMCAVFLEIFKQSLRTQNLFAAIRIISMVLATDNTKHDHLIADLGEQQAESVIMPAVLVWRLCIVVAQGCLG